MSTTTTASLRTPHHQYHHKKGAQTQSINQNSQLKKQLRDATRSLRRPGIPATVQQELERRVAHLNHLIGRREEDEKEKAIILRYRKVRFFENKKADRHLKQASQKFISLPTTETMAAYLKAKKDSIYCLTFPRTQKYISLFADSTNDDGSCSKVKESLLEQYSKDLLANIDISSALQLAKQDLSSLLRKASDASDASDDDDEDDDEEEDDQDEGEEEEEEEEEDNNEEDASEDDVSGTEDANGSDPENGSESSGSEDENGSSAPDSDSDSFDSEPSDSESYLTESDSNSDSEFDSDNSDSEDIADDNDDESGDDDSDDDVSGVSSDLSDEESDQNSDSASGSGSDSSQKRPSAKKTRKDF